MANSSAGMGTNSDGSELPSSSDGENSRSEEVWLIDKVKQIVGSNYDLKECAIRHHKKDNVLYSGLTPDENTTKSNAPIVHMHCFRLSVHWTSQIKETREAR